MLVDTALPCYCGRLLSLDVSVHPHRFSCACGHPPTDASA